MTDTKTFGLFGSSGFAREVMPIAKETLGDTHQLFFVENNVTDKIVNGYNVISEGAIVGMGAVVTKDVAPHTVVIGNPAKALER